MNRRLYRSVVDRRIGGVAAGTATYFDIDPSISRVLWILLAIVSGGVFLIVYLVMWAVVPEEPYPAAGAAPGGTEASAPRSGEASEEAGAAAGSPTPPASWPPGGQATSGPSGRVILGAILILIGAWFLADEFLPWLSFDLVWPIGLVVIGVVVLATALRRGT